MLVLAGWSALTAFVVSIWTHHSIFRRHLLFCCRAFFVYLVFFWNWCCSCCWFFFFLVCRKQTILFASLLFPSGYFFLKWSNDYYGAVNLILLDSLVWLCSAHEMILCNKNLVFVSFRLTCRAAVSKCFFIIS